jgi:hypothetical protein
MELLTHPDIFRFCAIPQVRHPPRASRDGRSGAGRALLAGAGHSLTSLARSLTHARSDCHSVALTDLTV